VSRLEKGAGALEAIFTGNEEKHFGSKTEVKLSGWKWLEVPESTNVPSMHFPSRVCAHSPMKTDWNK